MNSLKSINLAPIRAAIIARIGARAISTSAVIMNRTGLKQASNRDATWSENQIERSSAFKGPRFENTDIGAQVPFHFCL